MNDEFVSISLEVDYHLGKFVICFSFLFLSVLSVDLFCFFFFGYLKVFRKFHIDLC